MSRPVLHVSTAHRQQEGGGFIVRRPFPSKGIEFVDPFLMLDELGPIDYAPGEAIGAPDHPHRGFETVTYVIDGESEHEDSAGHRGVLRAGDVQWMTAGAGVVHSEMPSARMREQGGRVHGFQLWVNLPAKDKLIAPRYQELAAARIPRAVSPDGKARVVVIAGEALGVRAAIDTHTPILYQHWTLEPGADVVQPIRADWNATAYVFRGAARIADRDVRDGQLAVLGDGADVRLSVPASASGPAELLLLAGAPIAEPVAWYGPFVMNTEAELHQAVRDYQSGAMGRITR
jgi:redox-sensitive bicupin YhaK (pirin superfamily)